MLALVLFLASLGITALIFLPKVLANRNRSQAAILRGVQDAIRQQSMGQDSQSDKGRANERASERANSAVSQNSAAEDVPATNAARGKDIGEASGGVVIHNSSVAEIRRRAAASTQRASTTVESPPDQQLAEKQTLKENANDPTIEEIRKLLTSKEGEKNDATTLDGIRRLLSMS